MSNTFFAGLESFMEDAPEAQTKETASPEIVTAKRAEQEIAEAQEVAEQIGDNNAEGEQIVQQAEMVFAKFDELDRMSAHIEKYGVDKAFLFFCNHDNILGEAFNIRLPGYESFNTVGDPASAESIAALESIKEVAVKVWEFIKRLILNVSSWIVNLVSGYTRKCKKIDEHASTLEQSINKVAETTVDATDTVKYVDPEKFSENMSKMKAAFLDFSKLAQAACKPSAGESKDNNASSVQEESGGILNSLKTKITKIKGFFFGGGKGKDNSTPDISIDDLRKEIKLSEVNKTQILTVLKGVRQNIKQIEVFVSQDLAIYRKQLSDIRVFVQTCEKNGRSEDAKTCRKLAQTVAEALKTINGEIGPAIHLVSDNLQIAAKWLTAAKRDASPDKKE